MLTTTCPLPMTASMLRALVRVTTFLVPFVVVCPRAGLAQSSPYHAEMLAGATLRTPLSTPALTPALTVHPDFLGARRFRSRGPGATLMIIGGAGIVAGILVGGSGGTVLILGGVGVGAYGVYLYTR